MSDTGVDKATPGKARTPSSKRGVEPVGNLLESQAGQCRTQRKQNDKSAEIHTVSVEHGVFHNDTRRLEFNNVFV